MSAETTTPRERRRRKRLDEIRDEAMSMIIEDGLESFSVNKLAERLDFTPGALYRYFESKDAILAAVEIQAIEGFDRYFQVIDRELDDATPLERVVVMASGYMELEQLQPERFRLISHFVSGPEHVVGDDSAAAVIGPTLRVLGRFSMAVIDAMEAGSISEEHAFQRAAIAWSCVQGLIERRKLTRFDPELLSPALLLDELLKALLIGWGADPSAVQNALDRKRPTSFFKDALTESEQ